MRSRTVLILSAVLVIVFIFFIAVALRQPARPISDFERESFLESGAQSTSLGFLRILQNLQKIDFAQSNIFEAEAFRSLADFSVAIEPLEAGRNNPFAPISAAEIFQLRFNQPSSTSTENF